MPYMINFKCGCTYSLIESKSRRYQKEDRGKRLIFACPEHDNPRIANLVFKCAKCGKIEDAETMQQSEIHKLLLHSRRKLCVDCSTENKRYHSRIWQRNNKDRVKILKQYHKINITDHRKIDKVITKADCKHYLNDCLPKAAFDPAKPKYVRCNGCKRYAPVESNMSDHVKCSYDMICDNIYIFGDM